MLSRFLLAFILAASLFSWHEAKAHTFACSLAPTRPAGTSELTQIIIESIYWHPDKAVITFKKTASIGSSTVDILTECELIGIDALAVAEYLNGGKNAIPISFVGSAGDYYYASAALSGPPAHYTHTHAPNFLVGVSAGFSSLPHAWNVPGEATASPLLPLLAGSAFIRVSSTDISAHFLGTRFVYRPSKISETIGSLVDLNLMWRSEFRIYYSRFILAPTLGLGFSNGNPLSTSSQWFGNFSVGLEGNFHINKNFYIVLSPFNLTTLFANNNTSVSLSTGMLLIDGYAGFLIRI